MNCKNCGNLLNENDKFCQACGTTTSIPQIIESTPIEMNKEKDSSKNNKIFLALFGLSIFLIAFGCSYLFLSNLMTKNNSSSEKNSSSETVVTNQTSYSRVSYHDFLFSIPEDYIYGERNGVLHIYDEDGAWVALVSIEEGTYNQLVDNKNAIRTALENEGYTLGMPIEKSVGGLDYLLFEATYAGQNNLISLTSLSSTKYAIVEIMNQDNEYDYQKLEELSPILSSAKTESVTRNIDSSYQHLPIDFSKFAQ